MDINRANMDELFRGYQKIFQRGFDHVPSSYARFAGEVNSTTAVEVYPYLEQFGGMREWIGDRQIKHVASQKATIINRDFEDTVGVMRNDIEDDKYGLYGPMLEELGFNAGEVFYDLAAETLTSAADAVWIDGLPFFSDARKYGDDATIANLGGSALTIESYAAARGAMLQYRAHNNRVIKVRPNLLIVGPANEGAAYDVLKNSRKITAQVTGSGESAQVITGTVDNGYAGTAEILVLPELETQWFLADASRPLKPVIVQKRRVPKLTRIDRDEDEHVFMRKEFLYGADARGAAFFSMPHLIFGSFPA